MCGRDKAHFITRGAEVYATVKQFAMKGLVVLHAGVIDIAGGRNTVFVRKGKPKDRTDMKHLKPVVLGSGEAPDGVSELGCLRVEVLVKIVAFECC